MSARRVEPRGRGLDELERDVRHGEPGGRERLLPRASRRRASTSTPLAAAFSRVTSTATSSTSTATTGAKPSFAAAIEMTPEPQPTSSSDPRRSSSRSSSESRVEGCAPVPNARPGSITTASASAGGVLPRRPDPERADPDRVVELAPAVLPAVVDLADGCVREGREHPLGGGAVGGELDGAGVLLLLEPLGRELDERRPQLLGLRRPRR